MTKNKVTLYNEFKVLIFLNKISPIFIESKNIGSEFSNNSLKYNPHNIQLVRKNSEGNYIRSAKKEKLTKYLNEKINLFEVSKGYQTDRLKETPLFKEIPTKILNAKLSENYDKLHKSIHSDKFKYKFKDKIELPKIKNESILSNTHITNTIDTSANTKRIETNRKSRNHKKMHTLLTPSLTTTSQNANKSKNINIKNINNDLSDFPELMNKLIKNSKKQTTNEKNKLSNIINIVNNLDSKNDKQIAFKVNVNQYDLKIFVPSSGNNKDVFEYSHIDMHNVTDNLTDNFTDNITDNITQNITENMSDNLTDNVTNKFTSHMSNPFRKSDIVYNKPIRVLELSKAQKDKLVNYDIDSFNHEKDLKGETIISKNKDQDIQKLNNIISVNYTANFSDLNSNKQFLKMNTMSETPINCLPKFKLPKTMTLGSNIMKKHNKFTKSQDSYNSKIDQNISAGFSFLRKETNQISEPLLQSIQNSLELADYTFNKDGIINNSLNNCSSNVNDNTKSKYNSQKNIINQQINEVEVHIDNDQDFSNNNEIEYKRIISSDQQDQQIIKTKSIDSKNEQNFIKKESSKYYDFPVNTNNDLKEEDSKKYKLEKDLNEIEMDEIIGLEINDKCKKMLDDILNNIEIDSSISENIRNISKNDVLNRKKYLSYKKIDANMNNIFKKDFDSNSIKKTSQSGIENSNYSTDKYNHIINEQINRNFYNKHSAVEFQFININNLCIPIYDDTNLKLKDLDLLCNEAKKILKNKCWNNINQLICKKIKLNIKKVQKSKIFSFLVSAFTYNFSKFIHFDSKHLFLDKYQKSLSLRLYNPSNKLYEIKYFDIYTEMFDCWKDIEEIPASNIYLHNRSILENFTKTNIFSKKFIKNEICKISNSGRDLLKCFGAKNMTFINIFITRDCSNNFEDNKKKTIKRLKSIKKGILKSLSTKNTASEKDIRVSIEKKEKYHSTEIQIENELSDHNTKDDFKMNVKKKLSKSASFKEINHFEDDNIGNINNISFKKNKIRKSISMKESRIINMFPKKCTDGHKPITILNNYFFKNRQIFIKNDNKPTYKNHDDLDIHFRESSYLPMTRENTVYRTHEIKSNILRILKTPYELLCFHIKDNNFPKFKEIFEKKKIPIDILDKQFNSLLNLSVQSDNYEISEYLLNAGADVNLQNVKYSIFIFKKSLNSPLHYAMAHKNFKIVNLLISKNADQDLVNLKGLTPWQCLGYEVSVFTSKIVK